MLILSHGHLGYESQHSLTESSIINKITAVAICTSQYMDI